MHTSGRASKGKIAAGIKAKDRNEAISNRIHGTGIDGPFR